jgi:hypothetical protein
MTMSPRKPSIHPIKRNNTGGTGKNNQPANKTDDKSGKSPPVEDDDVEDGDIATPKRDRSGDDDQPL